MSRAISRFWNVFQSERRKQKRNDENVRWNTTTRDAVQKYERRRIGGRERKEREGKEGERWITSSLGD